MTVGEYGDYFKLFKKANNLTSDSPMPAPPIPSDNLNGVLMTRANSATQYLLSKVDQGAFLLNSCSGEHGYETDDALYLVQQVGLRLSQLQDHLLLDDETKQLYADWTEELIERRALREAEKIGRRF
jgi:hypothetical protein